MTQNSPIHTGQVALDACPKCRNPMCAYCQGEGDLCPNCRARDEGGVIPWEDKSRGWFGRFFMTITAVTKRAGVLFHQLEPGSGGAAAGFCALLHAGIAIVLAVIATVLTVVTAALGGPSSVGVLGTMLMAIGIGVPVFTVGSLIGYAIWGVLHHIAVSLAGGNGNLEQSIRTSSYASAVGVMWIVVPFVIPVPVVGLILAIGALLFHLVFVSLALVSVGVGRFGMRPGAARFAGFAPAALYLLFIVGYVVLVVTGTTAAESPDVYY